MTDLTRAPGDAVEAAGHPVGGGHGLVRFRHRLANEHVNIVGKNLGLFSVDRFQFLGRQHQIGTIALEKRRQRSRDERRTADRSARLGRELSSQLIQLEIPVVHARSFQVGAQGAIGIGRNDVGASGDIVGVDRAHHIRRVHQGLC